ncbi:hypothetical protein [Sphaerimonospora mesophila]
MEEAVEFFEDEQFEEPGKEVLELVEVTPGGHGVVGIGTER